jgi:hypothetical protein
VHTQLAVNSKMSTEITVTAGAAGVTTINGTVIDMSGFEGVLFIANFGVITAGALTSIKVQQGTASDGSDMADLAGTGQTIADTDDEKVFFADVFRPTKRYVRLVVVRSTQNAVVTAVAIQYHTRQAPVTHGTNVAGKSAVSPDEGTP